MVFIFLVGKFDYKQKAEKVFHEIFGKVRKILTGKKNLFRQFNSAKYKSAKYQGDNSSKTLSGQKIKTAELNSLEKVHSK